MNPPAEGLVRQANAVNAGGPTRQAAGVFGLASAEREIALGTDKSVWVKSDIHVPEGKCPI